MAATGSTPAARAFAGSTSRGLTSMMAGPLSRGLLARLIATLDWHGGLSILVHRRPSTL